MKGDRPDFTPTATQLELIEAPGTRFVEACPGSGKTSAIVARYERLATMRQRRGIALLSFTNAAVDEVVQRCTDHHVLTPPNFVGTFDGFINRFISGPWLAKRLDRHPQFIDTWDSIRAARFSFKGLPDGIECSLEQFDWDADDRYRFNPARVSGQWGNAIRAAYNKRPEEIDARAAKLRRKLIQEHAIVSSSASRHLALNILRGERRQAWLEILAGRFTEMIVDEAQDCGVEELAVLNAALEAGVTVVSVADVDQAIFEFRRADPARVAEFANRIGRGKRLDGNFRSSPAIVDLGGRLRASSTTDHSVGPERNNTLPVQVISFTQPDEVTTQVRVILADLGLADESCVVLAHRRDHAAECASAPISISLSRRNVIIIAAGHLVITNEVNSTRRKKALDDIERVLLNLAGQGGTDHHTTKSLGEHLGLTDRWVRDGATRLIYGADPTNGRAEYTAALRDIVGGLRWPRGVILPNLNHRLATPPENDWNNLNMTATALRALRWNTIHGAKGREFDVVVVVVPRRLLSDEEGNTCLDLWEKGLDGESRRVLYVGATRAKKVLILAVHADHYTRVTALVSPAEQVTGLQQQSSIGDVPHGL